MARQTGSDNPMGDTESEGIKKLESVWWLTIEELEEMVVLDGDPKTRLQAAEILLRYFIAMGQSINAPFIPETEPDDEEEDDDDDE